MSHSRCQILFEAGKALVEKSGLAHYSGSAFVVCDSKARFDHYWRKTFHPELGRYMAWVLFSVGAQNLAKAACVCKSVKVVGEPAVPGAEGLGARGLGVPHDAEPVVMGVEGHDAAGSAHGTSSGGRRSRWAWLPGSGVRCRHVPFPPTLWAGSGECRSRTEGGGFNSC